MPAAAPVSPPAAPLAEAQTTAPPRTPPAAQQAGAHPSQDLKQTVAHILQDMAKAAAGNVAGTLHTEQVKMVNSETPPDGSPEKCIPKCNWKCDSASCDQVCTPQCQTPQCQTRCTGMSTDGCHMQCGQPRCRSVCSQSDCPNKNCPVCKTECSKPMCTLVCPAGAQNCKDVCETPACSWTCTAPKICPKPQCQLTCDSPKNCQKDSTFKELPPLQKDEVIIQSYEMPLSLQQQSLHHAANLTMSVAVQRMVAVPGKEAMELEQRMVRLPVKML